MCSDGSWLTLRPAVVANVTGSGEVRGEEPQGGCCVRSGLAHGHDPAVKDLFEGYQHIAAIVVMVIVVVVVVVTGIRVW